MTELTQMIAEAEGVRTPTRKRSKAEREKIVADHNAKRAAKKKTARPNYKFALDTEVIIKTGKRAGEKDIIVNRKPNNGKPLYQLKSDAEFVAETSIRLEIGTNGKPVETAKPKTTVVANNIPLNFVSDTGCVREAGYDEKTKFFYVGFAKSTWAMPSSQKEWDDFEKAIADPNVDIDAYYRKAFRGRTGEMIPVRRKEVVA